MDVGVRDDDVERLRRQAGGVDDMLRCLWAGLQRDAIDRGPEPEAMYESDMKVYVGTGKPEVEANIATMKRWAAEGK